ncbi:hypothetical protein [uncultured Acinetobacter sp.]|uniref:hypothetical protein n=1 Tax=uncultured Acinetobacter sp. TaxID=165433 RepID=UPI00258BFB55|nr:hypothetical protein [uncultured Acinetobacter sp.]
MLTVLIEVIMSVFIANFKASEHPIINIIVKGVLIAIVMFLLVLFSDISQGKETTKLLNIVLALAIGLVISIVVFFIEKFFDYIDKK